MELAEIDQRTHAGGKLPLIVVYSHRKPSSRRLRLNKQAGQQLRKHRSLQRIEERALNQERDKEDENGPYYQYMYILAHELRNN